MRMTMAFLLASVSLAAIDHQAVAQDTTQAAAQIRVESYSPLKRTEIVGVIGQPTTITFPAGESVYRVVQSGKPDKDGTLADAGWEGASPSEIKDTPLGNNLTLWPVVPGESTMSVITMSSEGTQKVYPFRLLAKPDAAGAADSPNVVLNLIFKGGATPDPAPAVQKVAANRVLGSKTESKTGRASNCRTAFAHRRVQYGRWSMPLHCEGQEADPNRATLSDGQWRMDTDAIPWFVRETSGLHCRAGQQ